MMDLNQTLDQKIINLSIWEDGKKGKPLHFNIRKGYD